MDVLEERSRIHLSMSYRGRIGYRIKGFVGHKRCEPCSHLFWRYRRPFDDYTALDDRGKGQAIPFQLGTIFFHNVPGVRMAAATKTYFGGYHRKSQPGTTRTFDSNPGFRLRQDTITVVRRIYGSSSTSLISQ